ncbi:MAG TPA: DUF1559 domain-containing protein [Pirellulaceae bacterium]|nr:DUF1559 domain-containing protein [Pirellulaceae bacterium]
MSLFRSTWPRLASSVLALTVGLWASASRAQQEIEPAAQAALVVDIDVARFVRTSLLDGKEFSEGVANTLRGSNFGGPNPLTMSLSQATRITVLLSPPPDIHQLNNLEPGQPLPMNFMVRIEYDNAEIVEHLFDDIANQSRIIMVGDKQLYTPDDDFSPSNLCAAKGSPTCLEFGTRAYVEREEFILSKLATSRLMDLWDRQPDHAIRLAMDGIAAKGFLNGVMQDMLRNVPFEARPFVELINKVASLRMSVDLEASHMLVMAATGHNESDADTLQTGIEALVEMAKFMLMTGEREMTRETPELFHLLNDLVKGMKTERNGVQVSMDLSQPPDFGRRFQEITKQMRAMAAETQKLNELRMVLLAMHNYEAVHQRLPFVAAANEDPRLSWRVQLLPYLDEGFLYNQIDLQQSWDHPNNRDFGRRTPGVYGNHEDGMTGICFVTPDVIPQRFRDIRDGTSNSIALLASTTRRVPWMKPEDITIDAALAMYDALQDGEYVLAGFYDGSVRRINASSVTREEFRAMLDPNDGR